MRDTQPPITNDEEYAGYQAGLERMNAVCAAREQRLFDTRHNPDPSKLDHARSELFTIYGKRQGINDAIVAYEQKMRHSA